MKYIFLRGKSPISSRMFTMRVKFIINAWSLLLPLACQGVLDGKYDDLPEQSFYMVGGIEEVIAKAEKIAKESAA